MDNKTKLLAEKYLYDAASRFFEEPDCVELAQMNESKKLTEKRMQITDPDTGKSFFADVPDSILYQAKLADDAFEEMGEEDFTAAAEPAVLAKRIAAKKDADTARFNANTAGENAYFTKLLPRINAEIAKVAEDGVKSGEVKQQDGTWFVDPQWAFKAQDKIYRTVVAPVVRQAGGAVGRALRDSWEAFIGWRGGRGFKLAKFKNAVTKYANDNIEVVDDTDVDTAADIQDSCEFGKRLFANINETLKKMYAERYDVTLDEASKMFIVDDSKLF